MMLKWLAGIYLGLILLIIFIADQPTYKPLLRIAYVIPYGDKVGHFVLLGLLSLLFNLAYQCVTFKVGRYQLLKASVIIAILITLEELSQRFFPSRTFDLGDLFFNYLGIWIFGRWAVWLHQRRPKIQDKSS